MALGNVAAGNKGMGMIFHCTGGIEGGKYVGLPKAVMDDVYTGFPNKANLSARRWEHDHLYDFPNPCVVADVPILCAQDFTAYTCLVGFNLRWNNHESLEYYADHLTEITATSAANVARIRQAVDDLVLWNNEEGFRARYCDKTDFENVTAVNHLSHDREDWDDDGAPDWHDGATARDDMGEVGEEQQKRFGETYDWPYTGASFEQASIHSITITEVFVAGYPVAIWREDWEDVTTSQVTLSGQTFVAALENQSMTNQNLKPAVTNLSGTGGSGSVALTWTQNSNNTNPEYLIRFRKVGTPYWSYHRPTDTNQSETISGLENDETFEFQVMYSKLDKLSPWTASATAETQ